MYARILPSDHPDEVEDVVHRRATVEEAAGGVEKLGMVRGEAVRAVVDLAGECKVAVAIAGGCTIH